MKILRYEPTPNPDAYKCILDGPLSQTTLSFLNSDDASDHPVAGPLFGTGDVRAVLIGGNWMTVNKNPGASWKALKPVIERTLADM